MMLFSARIGGFPGIRLSRAFAGGVCILLAATGASGQCQYDVTVIQGPDVCGILGPVLTFGTGLNENGAVVGRWNCPASENRRAFVWTPDSGLVTLEIPTGFSGAEAWGINGLGHVVGRITLAAIDRYRAALWQDGQAFNLGTLPGGNYSEAFAINERGQIVGQWGHNFMKPFFPRSFVWQDGTMSDLELPMGPRSGAHGLNEQGQIVGWMGESFLIDSHAFIWKTGVVTDIGVIQGVFTGRARAINNLNEVVGSGQIPDADNPFGLSRAFYWADGQMMNLGTLNEHCSSVVAFDVNDLGQVVGSASGAATNAFIWQNGGMTNLNDLIPPELGVNVRIAFAINNQGQITGQASTASGVVAVLLTPVKPPGDLDGDCRVRVPDLLTLLAAWGRCPPACPADLNDDGTAPSSPAG